MPDNWRVDFCFCGWRLKRKYTASWTPPPCPGFVVFLSSYLVLLKYIFVWFAEKFSCNCHHKRWIVVLKPFWQEWLAAGCTSVTVPDIHCSINITGAETADFSSQRGTPGAFDVEKYLALWELVVKRVRVQCLCNTNLECRICDLAFPLQNQGADWGNNGPWKAVAQWKNRVKDTQEP